MTDPLQSHKDERAYAAELLRPYTGERPEREMRELCIQICAMRYADGVWPKPEIIENLVTMLDEAKTARGNPHVRARGGRGKSGAGGLDMTVGDGGE